MNDDIGQFIVAIGMIIQRDNKFLIAKRSPNKDVGPNMWEFPSGRLSYNEDLLKAIYREGLEELSIEVKPEQLIHAYNFMRIDKPCVVLNYLCKANDEPKLSDEHSEYKWVNLDELPKYFKFQSYLDTVNKLKSFINGSGTNSKQL
jgi:8-oxo-dGTP diphosphatase